jgi:hypothetical protein
MSERTPTNRIEGRVTASQALGFQLCTISSDRTLLRAVARSELVAARAG